MISVLEIELFLSRPQNVFFKLLLYFLQWEKVVRITQWMRKSNQTTKQTFSFFWDSCFITIFFFSEAANLQISQSFALQLCIQSSQFMVTCHPQGSSGADDLFEEDSYSPSSLSSSSLSSVPPDGSQQVKILCTSCGQEIVDRYLLKVRIITPMSSLLIMTTPIIEADLWNSVLNKS